MVGGTPPIIGGWKPGAGTKEERRGEGVQLRLRLGVVDREREYLSERRGSSKITGSIGGPSEPGVIDCCAG